MTSTGEKGQGAAKGTFEEMEEHLEDLEDYRLAEQRMEQFDPADVIPLEDLMALYDLDD